MVADIYGWFEYFYLLARYLCTFEAANDLLSLARKHRTADDLDPSATSAGMMWL
jgi:hypothetical protein